MSEILRYDGSSLGPVPDGVYVYYADIKELQAALASACKEIEGYKEVGDSLQKEIKRLDGELKKAEAESAAAIKEVGEVARKLGHAQAGREEAVKGLVMIAAQDSGIIGSTAKADCMAAIAQAVLNNLSAKEVGRVTTMHEKYGDGSNHIVCGKCGLCITCQDCHCRASAILSRLNDDGLAEEVAIDCHDPAHDPRWCPTCEARRDGIEDYRKRVKEG